MVGTANGSRTPITPCQAFSVVNGGQDPGLQSGRGSIAGSDCGGMEFTREEVDALLNTKIRTKDKFNLKRLMNEKEEELNSIIEELRMNYSVLQDKFTKEEAEKLAAIEAFFLNVQLKP
ncbi:hypothetical protein HanRHA438_Chr01g0019951 [Helianthus annuus]|nr:hypothetical protein HanHA300_Chr01g0015821 [Helianthus annuus]KAJ0622487.1 hypothetical protein HanIR_Chr01g0021241 [Helianthus annuus]KAJ0626738.1 hypothetical protein HanHA89_Chr01g0017431 [Helianthus annuus]KAJ0783086.1 hypothetical protein HanLR1_Chr01g0016371 [Helianthus annuus]KAJ0947789.1 hypothetical protein HanRHA438_Chr01g0019951 [Helianthus annuus]